MDVNQLVETVKNDPRVPLGIAGLAVILTGLVLTANVSVLLDLPSPNTGAVVVPPTTSSTMDLAAVHLFGHYQASLANLPMTQLQLTLEGTDVANTSRVPSTAIIADTTGKASVYKVGDTVPGGAIIENIEPHRVILNHNENQEVLELPLPKLT